MMIHLLFTGGTISMAPSAEAGGAVPAFNGAELVKRIDGLAAIAPVKVEDWGLFPAAHLDLGRLWTLRERVREVIEEAKGADGVVITHGTDTMEETAYLLARTLPRGKPIVVTGAMRNAAHPAWDGAENLRNAVRVAAAPGSQGRGAMVAFAGEIFDGLDAVKVDTDELGAFEAAHGVALGKVGADGVSYTEAAPPAKFAVQPSALSAKVGLIAVSPGDDGTMFESTLGKYDGLVVQAFGAGNVPPGAAQGIERWIASGVPVVIASRCRRGEVAAAYAFDGGAAKLVEAGALLAGPRTPAQAWMELTISLSAGRPYGK
jgi:L-asparaginase